MRTRSCLIAGICWLLAGVPAVAGEDAAGLPDFSWLPKAPPLAAPGGEAIRVDSVEGLFAAAEKVRPGGTILLADGHYPMPRYFELHTDGVTLRSASGRREKVILDGSQSRHGELVGVTRCSGVTITSK